MTSSIFFPQEVLDVLVDEERIDLDGGHLVLSDNGLRYKVAEAVRVLREVTTGEDPFELCGKVKQRDKLSEELGAEVLGDSMLVEDSGYDVIPGFLGAPSNELDGDKVAFDEEQALAALQALLDPDKTQKLTKP